MCILLGQECCILDIWCKNIAVICVSGDACTAKKVFITVMCDCVHLCSGVTHLMRAEWGSGPREGEGHGGCYDNFIIIFEK